MMSCQSSKLLGFAQIIFIIVLIVFSFMTFTTAKAQESACTDQGFYQAIMGRAAQEGHQNPIFGPVSIGGYNNQEGFYVPRGCYVVFDFGNGWEGAFFVSESTPVVLLDGEIWYKYVELHLVDGPLGYPTTDVRAAAHDGAINYFEHGAIYWHWEAGGAHAVWGAIFVKYLEMGETESNLGYPISDELWPPNTNDLGPNLRASKFQNGIITYNEITWVVEVLSPQEQGIIILTATLTERCSREVIIVGDYDDGLDGVPNIFLTREMAGPDGYTPWSYMMHIDQQRVRWFCHSTTGNLFDLGTWDGFYFGTECDTNQWCES